MNDLAVFVGPRNGRAQRLVVLKHQVREYRDSIDADSGFARQQTVKRAAERFGLDLAELAHVDAEIVRKADEEDARGDDTKDVRFRGVSFAQLVTTRYKLDFLIDESLVAGQPCIVGGSQKTLKTLLAVDAAISLATASQFLGVVDVPRPVRVGFMSGEGGLPVLQEYAVRVALARGVQDAPGLVFCDTLPQLDDLRHVDALADFIGEHQLEVVVLDPLYLCMPGDDAANLLKQGKTLRHVNHVCGEAGCTPVLIHHTKKGVVDPFAPAELSDLSWSGFSEFAGQWWLISRREKYDPDRVGEHRLWLNIGGRAGHGALHALDIDEGRRSDPDGRRWEVRVLSPQEAREGARDAAADRKEAEQQERERKRLEADRARIVKAMVKYPEGETAKTIRETAGLKPSRFSPALASLLQDEDVLPCDVQKSNRNTPYEGYKLAE